MNLNPHATKTTNSPNRPTQYINFIFFKVDPAFRRLSKDEQKRRKDEFQQVVKEYMNHSDLMLLYYSLVGIRADVDFMLWRITNRLELFQEMTTKLLHTGLGQYLTVTYSYLSISKRSMYVDKIEPEHQNSRAFIIPGKYKYLFVYPFVKTRDWYHLTFATRQGMMDEHIQIGNKYPSVKLNTTYSFGIDDQEFVVAFETDEPKDFLDLVQELRETEASRYTLRDTPMYTCIRKNDIDELLETI
ncbi:chlorite dismutase family protein [Tepidibacillus fermentans]|uniref:Coproheme decarboxylase n=1 Tax=Tepidibacillus fermentans TaxID=1281767 RepID=A0A4R3KK81_9BACI|nr:chlorite dismutase family protein [Tepidibacillus fermentans]TCS83130.1 chlorite dismutase [Tepidibacillus fermentans]